jgi:hypothetical protein
MTVEIVELGLLDEDISGIFDLEQMAVLVTVIVMNQEAAKRKIVGANH